MIFKDGSKVKYILGYDLGEQVSQISYLADHEEEPRTFSLLAGAEAFDIPIFLAKQRGVNQWFFGAEAQKQVQEGRAIPLYGLLTAARRGEEILLDEASFDPVALLSLFIKRSLAMLSMELDPGTIEAIMFTTRQMDETMVHVLQQVQKALTLPIKKCYFENYEASLFYYILNEKDAYRGHDVIACDLKADQALFLYDLSFDQKTTPIVATVTMRTYEEMAYHREGLPEEAVAREKARDMLDEEFLSIAEGFCRGRVISSIYLLGDGFKDKWMKRSLSYLCRTRKVFQGTNLFSKGACFALRQKLLRQGDSPKFLLLGEDKLRSNLGIQVLSKGEEIYYPLLEAGINWYDATASVDLILLQGSTLYIQSTPLAGGIAHPLCLQLQIPQDREERTTRIRLALQMSAANRLLVTAIDMGFGDYVQTEMRSFHAEFQV